MKHFVWMLCGIFVSGLLLGTLSACGADQVSMCVITTNCSPDSSAPAVPEDGEEEPPPDSAPDEPAAPSGDAERNLAYASVLEDALFNGVLPDGTRLDWTGVEEAAKNRFALCDVDGDGEEELLLFWTNASTAGQMGVVYGWEDGGVRQELCETPDLTFYSSGTAAAGWSHNQGWAGRFWPYTLYQYAPETRDYVEAGAVDAWDLALTEGDETLAAAFPSAADADGDGLVYYILTGEWYKQDRIAPDGSLCQLWGTDPVDGAALEEWMISYTGGAEVMDIPRQDLTEENIAALSRPNET